MYNLGSKINTFKNKLIFTPFKHKKYNSGWHKAKQSHGAKRSYGEFPNVGPQKKKKHNLDGTSILISFFFTFPDSPSLF